MKLPHLLSSVFHLFLPNPCLGCGKPLSTQSNILCLLCDSKIAVTPFHLHTINYVTEKFVGRANIVNGASMTLFSKHGMMQHLMHQLKYKSKKEIGIYLGEKYGKILSELDDYSKIDCIVPVPLHDKKKEIRGYNQSEYFAIGLSNRMQKPVLVNGLVRLNLKESQTRKKRLERWKNVESDFDCLNETSLENKHILLVDDVLTTGATLDSCITILNQIKGTKVSIATIAVVMN
jgi:ComF family protein